jgi:elongation factor P hydroxylase
MMMIKVDSRYPYTYSCDFLRAYGGADKDGVRLSRSDASQVRGAVAKALGMPDEELARKLADYYLANEEETSERSMRDLLPALGLATPK